MPKGRPGLIPSLHEGTAGLVAGGLLFFAARRGSFENGSAEARRRAVTSGSCMNESPAPLPGASLLAPSRIARRLASRLTGSRADTRPGCDHRRGAAIAEPVFFHGRQIAIRAATIQDRSGTQGRRRQLCRRATSRSCIRSSSSGNRHPHGATAKSAGSSSTSAGCAKTTRGFPATTSARCWKP